MKPKELLRSAWKKTGSIHLTVTLCLVLAADLAAGYFCLKGNGHIFATLGEVGLWQWFATYGRHNLQVTAWFYVLLVLLAALVANTFACTTDRVIRLAATRPRRLAFRLAPHAMHYAIILMLAGYLVSYLASCVVTSCVLVPGRPVAVAGTGLKLELVAWKPEYYRLGRMPAFAGRVVRPRAVLSLTAGRRTRTAVLEAACPVRFAGYGIFMKNFGPKKKGGMSSRVFLELSVRRDPGLPFYFAGMALFVAGLALYLYDRVPAKKTDGETVCKPA